VFLRIHFFIVFFLFRRFSKISDLDWDGTVVLIEEVPPELLSELKEVFSLF